MQGGLCTGLYAGWSVKEWPICRVVCERVAYMQSGLWKKQLITSFVKHFIVIKILYASIFKFIIQNKVKRSVLKRLSTIKGYVQGALRKKQLIVSFVKHFTENDENTICIVFQFCNQKLSLEGCFKPYVYYTRLCTGCSTKEQTDSFFRRALYKENHENIICVCFHFYISKLSQETCFILSLLYGTINRVLYERSHWKKPIS